MEKKIRGKDSDRVIWEFKFLWKIRELCEKLEKTDIDNKEAESTISTPPGQRKYKMKQQERDASSEKEHIAIYGFIDKLHKQLQKCQSRKRTWATIRRQCEELRTSLTETPFERERERERVIRRIYEADLNCIIKEICVKLQKMNTDKTEVEAALHGWIKELYKMFRDINNDKKEVESTLCCEINWWRWWFLL